MGEEGEVELRETISRKRRPRSTSYIAVRSALYQLNSLGDFKREKIGGGFYADVYKVEHRSTGEVMVLKMNKSRKTSKQMLIEIQLMNRLSHPNILGFKGSCVHEGQLHALTEYINGGSLEDLLLNRTIDLSWSVRVKIARDIVRGMTYLHSRGLFHRDLTSKNCLVQREPNGTIRTVVADFGLAAKIKHNRRRSHTEIVGSPYWMAPECLHGKQYCEQADVFSYGIILAEIMARIPADPDFMPRTKRFGVDFEALKKLCMGCPDEMWQLMCKCCQMDPDERPTFEEALKTLELIDLPDDIPDHDVRSCYSEPSLRTRDSDDDTSSSICSSEGVEKLQFACDTDQRLSATSSPCDDLEGGCTQVENLPILSGKEGTLPEKILANNLGDLCADNWSRNGSRQTLVAEEDENKGADSGIDPGEMFKCNSNPSSLCEGKLDTAGIEQTPESSPQTKVVIEAPQNRLGEHTEIGSGERTPVSASPSLCGRKIQLPDPTSDTAAATSTPVGHTLTDAFKTPANANESSRHMAFVLPSGRCTSPLAPSWTSSDFSSYLPTPSTPWAPPCSPVALQKASSHSLPSSSSYARPRTFRFSQVIPPCACDFTCGCGAHRIPFSSCVHQQHETDKKGCFLNSDNLCTNLDEEHFSHMDLHSPSHRSRSHSNPVFAPRRLSANYSLTLARYSPDSAQGSGSLCKCYNISPHKNYRVSFSAPNLPQICSSLSGELV